MNSSTVEPFITKSSSCLLQANVLLSDKNWFKTGGTASWYTEPTSIEQFQAAIQLATHNQWPVFVLGQGANILISDDGFHGLVIRPELKSIRRYDYNGELDCSYAIVEAGAGVDMETLINYCLINNLQGLEEFSGIPGTVGGAVFINIHYFEFLLSKFLFQAEVIHKTTGNLHTVTPEWFNFGYNYSTLHAEEYYLVKASFKLKKVTLVETAYNKGRHDEMVRYRARRYPTSHTCGSFFRNFYPEEVTLEINGKKMIYVAYYLDKLGCKGELSYGGALVSYQHANMLINTGSATSTDIIMLARTMQEKVYQYFGIIPQPECRLIGFTSYPLLK